jgi:hypothetical protein
MDKIKRPLGVTITAIFYLLLSLFFLFASLVGFIAMFAPGLTPKPGVIGWLLGWIYTFFSALGLFLKKKWGWFLVLISLIPCLAISIIGIPVMAFQKEWILVFLPYLTLLFLSAVVLLYLLRPKIKEYFFCRNPKLSGRI